jgi:hypothetical protein
VARVPPSHGPLRRLGASLLRTVTLVPALECFRFASGAHEVTIDTAVRVAAGGKIVGFGDAAAGRDETRVLRALRAAGAFTVEFAD